MFRSASVLALLFAAMPSHVPGLEAAETERGRSASEVEELLLGTWRGGPCGGTLRFLKDGTFQRRGYSPGNNEISGTWVLRWNSLPPTLILTNKTSDDLEAFPPGKTLDVKVVRLSAEALVYAYSEKDRSEYLRMTPRDAAAAQVKDLVMSATITQAIGSFNSYGIPHKGDAFELDLGKPPKAMLQMERTEKQEGPSYIPFGGPLVVERVEEGTSITGPGRMAIYLSSDEAGSKFRIQIFAEGRAKGSKLRITLYQEGGFVGSMAEAEGVWK